MSKKILCVLLCLCSLAACTVQETPPQQEEIVEESTQVTVPVEKESLPFFTEEEWAIFLEREDSEADTAPPIEPIVPFLESEACRNGLKELHRGVDDWSVLFEHDSYKKMRMYDPVSNCYRQQYVPYRICLLETKQHSEFDRLLAVSYDYCDVEHVNGPKQGYQVQRKSILLAEEGKEEEWKLGDLTEAKLVTEPEEPSFSLWLPEQERALLVQVEQDFCTLKLVEHMTEQPPIMIESSHIKAQHGGIDQMGADWILDVKLGEERKLAYYRTSTHTLHYFEDGLTEQSLPRFTEPYYLSLLKDDCMHFYDLEAEDPGKIVKTLGGEGNGLSEQRMILDRNSLTVDLEDMSTHVIFFQEADGEFWNIAKFDSRGNVQSLIQTTLPVPKDDANYLTHTELRGGILSFCFVHAGDEEKSYYMDVREGMDHGIYPQQVDFQLGFNEESRQLLTFGDKIGMWTLENLEMENDPKGNLAHLTADFSGFGKISGVLRRHSRMESGYEFVVDTKSRNDLPQLAGKSNTKRLYLGIEGSAGIEEKISNMDFGEEIACTIYIDYYQHVFSYTEAQDRVRVTRLDISGEVCPEGFTEYGRMIKPLLYQETLCKEFSDKKPLQLDFYEWYIIIRALKDGDWTPTIRVDRELRAHPQEEVEGILAQYLPIEIDSISEQSKGYRADLKAYVEPNGLGGFSPAYQITDVKTGPDTVTLTVEMYNEVADVFNRSDLTVEYTDQGWRYVSNVLREKVWIEEILEKYHVSMEAPGYTESDPIKLKSYGAYMLHEDIDHYYMLELRSVLKADEAWRIVPDSFTEIETREDIVVGKWSGEVLHQKKNVYGELVHEFHYFLSDGIYKIHAVGKPVYGIGTGTQNELFQQCLSTLEVTPK